MRRRDFIQGSPEESIYMMAIAAPFQRLGGYRYELGGRRVATKRSICRRNNRTIIMSTQNATSMYCNVNPTDARVPETISATILPTIKSGTENRESTLPPVSSSAEITP